MKNKIFKILALSFIPFMSFGFSPATNQVWSAPDGMNTTNYVAEITANGNAKFAGTVTAGTVAAPSQTIGSLAVQTNATIAGTLTGLDALTTGNLTVQTNATVGGTLGVTGVATLTATPVLLNGLTVNTNATIGGTLGVTGVPTFTASNLAFNGTALVVGTVTQLVPAAYLKVQLNGTNYIIKAYDPLGP